MGEGSGAVSTSVDVALSCLHRSSPVCAVMADGDGRTTPGTVAQHWGRPHSVGDGGEYVAHVTPPVHPSRVSTCPFEGLVVGEDESWQYSVAE
jgi:hypothetical protein